MVTATAMKTTGRQSKEPFRADRLRDVRLRRGLTQEDVQRDLGIGAMTLSRYEQGKSRPLPDILVALAVYLEVSTDYLLGLSDTPNDTLQESDLTPDEKEVLQAYRDNDMDSLLQKALERRRKKPGN